MFIHFFFFKNTATTEIYTLSLHDALPIFLSLNVGVVVHLLLNVYQAASYCRPVLPFSGQCMKYSPRSEEHTSELQSRGHLVCRLLLEKKNTKINPQTIKI